MWGDLLKQGIGLLGGPIGSAAVGLIGGALNSRPKTTTQTQTFEREYTPDQVTARDNFLSGALDMVSNPGAGLTPLKNSAMQQVNQQYAGAPQRLQQSAALRGFGDSGKLFEGLMNFDVARSGDLARTNNDFAGKEIDQKNRGLQMLFQLLGLNNKSTTTTTGTQPGNMLGGALTGLTNSGALNDLFRGGGQDVGPGSAGFNGG